MEMVAEAGSVLKELNNTWENISDPIHRDCAEDTRGKLNTV